ncbi:MAG: hypothetical protein J3Q66DRAFT_404433 [Benniella sp.]|nr:MAG: hypothetical protein J3Q66DRAFT_404433 [Benniella sp.]
MLNIPELDSMICLQLNPDDLARCARVNKRWHNLVTPHLWRDLTWLKKVCRTSQQAFCLMVLEDYLAEQKRHASEDNAHLVEQPIRPSDPVSTLSKYRHWIQLLPDPYQLRIPLFGTTGENGPTAYKLLLYLFTRCPSNVQVEFFNMNCYDLDSPQIRFDKGMIDFSLPRLRHLYLVDRTPIPHTKASKLVDLLDRCGEALWKMELDIVIYTARLTMDESKEELTEDDQKGWPSLKELTLYSCQHTRQFWSRFFKRCGQVEKLELRRMWTPPETIAGGVSTFIQSILANMPKLTDITLGFGCKHGELVEPLVEALLSGSTRGWKRVRLGSGAEFRGEAMDALKKHLSTLEILELSGYYVHSSDDIVHVLRYCTLLQSFTIIDEPSRLDAEVFIDLDSDTGSLKPWGCEATLKELKVRITGIPSPARKVDCLFEEAYVDSLFEEVYTGQGLEMQAQLYDRLARLVNLETLWLGDECNEVDIEYLEMSLESGLHKLSGLKRLKELCVKGLCTKIGLKEVQWMVKNWPRLRIINGLDGSGDEKEAVEWLLEYHPEIAVWHK